VDSDQIIDQLWTITEKQLLPALDQLLKAAQQLDAPGILKNMPQILQQGGMCKFSPEELENFSSSTQQLMNSLKSLGAEQLVDLGAEHVPFLLQAGAGSFGKLLPVEKDFIKNNLGQAAPEDGLGQMEDSNVDDHSLKLSLIHDRAQLPSFADLQLLGLQNVELPSMESWQLPSWEEVKLPTVEGLTNFLSGPDSPVIYTLRNGTFS